MLIQLEAGERRGEEGGNKGGSGIRIADEKRYVCVCMRACAFLHSCGRRRSKFPSWMGMLMVSVLYISFFKGGHKSVFFLLLHHVRLRPVKWKDHDTHGIKPIYLERCKT